MEKIVKREDLVCKTDKHVYTFQQYETKRFFAKNIFAGKITLDKADKDQNDLLNNFIDYNQRTKLRDREKNLK